MKDDCLLLIGVAILSLIYQASAEESTAAEKCNLYVEDWKDCIPCKVKESSKDDFEHHFKDPIYESFCQTQVDAGFEKIVQDLQSREFYLIAHLHSVRQTIDQTEEILFHITYVNDSTQTRIDAYFSVDVTLRGANRGDLPDMRLPFPLEDLDLTREIHVESHSKHACGGLHSEFNIASVQEKGVDIVEFRPAVSNDGCEYTEIFKVDVFLRKKNNEQLKRSPENSPFIQPGNPPGDKNNSIKETKGTDSKGSQFGEYVSLLVFVVSVSFGGVLTAALVVAFRSKRKKKDSVDDESNMGVEDNSRNSGQEGTDDERNPPNNRVDEHELQLRPDKGHNPDDADEVLGNFAERRPSEQTEHNQSQDQSQAEIQFETGETIDPNEVIIVEADYLNYNTSNV